MRNNTSPSHRDYSQFRCEEGTIVDVDRKRWTCRVDTTHSSKSIDDVKMGVPYVHNRNGEGYHHLPEVGATVMVAWPSDNTGPFVLCYLPIPSVVSDDNDDGPTRQPSTDTTDTSTTDVEFRANRPDMNPGDLALTTRDENFLFLRRGGVVQIGATPIAQRIYLPVLNYIRDFAENYSMETPGVTLEATVERAENDPSGDAPATYTMHVRSYAQDELATVRARYLPLVGPDGGDRAAWDIYIAPRGINLDTGEVQSEVYRLVVSVSGDKTEIMGASRSVTIHGDDELTVDGSQTVSVGSDASLHAGGNLVLSSDSEASLSGGTVKVGSRSAASPSVLGDALIQWFATAQWTVAGNVASVSPASAATLQRILSRKVYVE